MRFALCAALPWVAATRCLADEGFFTGNRPPAVAAIWRSVFALQCERRRSVYVASAFLVDRVEKDRANVRHRRRADYYFVTAGHAIAQCKGRRRTLFENLDQPEFEPDGITVARSPLRLRSPEIVYVDKAYDLAILKAEAPSSADIGAPIAVDGTCDPDVGERLFTVGFAGVEKRRSLRLKREEKRWSKGAIVGLGKAEFRGKEELYIATTIDSLPGSSGGPAVNDKGVLIGVVAKGVAAEENKFRYDVDPKEPRDWQTFLAPCTAVKRLLHKSGLE